MTSTLRATATHSLIALAACLSLLCAPAASATPVSPLPASDYRVRPACPEPLPGHAACLALALTPATAAARAHVRPLGITRNTPMQAPSPAEGAFGLRPVDLADAYFPGEPAEAAGPQTIALVDAYNDPDAEADLNTYSRTFGLPELARCAHGATSDCFEQVNQSGKTANLPFPQTNAEREAELEACNDEGAGESCEKVQEADGWALEMSTDIEISHAICQNCRILLVEASSTEYSDLEQAEDTAASLGASEVSNSWAGPEPGTDSSAFDHPGTVITAASGDDGYLNWTEALEASLFGEAYNVGANYPASSPHVVAVGGTKLTLSSKGSWQSESVWNDDPREGTEDHGAGGSACSRSFEAPAWQRALPDWSSVGCGERRAVADVAADADPYTGVAVYDSMPYSGEEPEGWEPIGGTSVASPIIAAMYALAGGAHGVEDPAQTLYSHLETKLLHPVTTGGNGECDASYASACTGSMSESSSRFAFDCGKGLLICNAAVGCEGHYYDGPAGVGTPDGIDALKPEVHTLKEPRPCEPGTNLEPSNSPEPKNSPGPKEEGPPANKGAGESTGGASVAGARSASAAGGVGTSAAGPTLSALSLTRAAILALNSTQPRASQVGFTFTISASARVHVTLARRVRVRGRGRWRLLADSLTINATAGHNSRRLHGRGTLAPGLYELTLTPLHGTAHSLTFTLG